MTTYAIAQRTKTGSFTRNDLPTFDKSADGYFYIKTELMDFDCELYFITPIEN